MATNEIERNEEGPRKGERGKMRVKERLNGLTERPEERVHAQDLKNCFKEVVVKLFCDSFTFVSVFI